MFVPPLLLVVLVAMTAIEWPFLRDNGWSVTRRSDVAWPSILTLANGGWVVSLTFVASGAMGLLFGIALRGTLPRQARVSALLLCVVGAALMVVALRPDPPGANVRTWHGELHDYAYPLIPLCTIGAAALLAITTRHEPRWSVQRRLALAAVFVLLPLFALTGVGAIAQLARYVLLGAVMLWFELLGLGLLSAVRQDVRTRP